MGKPAQAALAVGSLIFSAVAGAQAPNPYDGTYAGVSSTSSGRVGPRACSDFAARPLTVMNGSARTTFFLGTDFSGNVDPQGQLVLRSPQAKLIIRGQIDAQGRARGNLIGNGFLYGCVWDLVWQRSAR